MANTAATCLQAIVLHRQQVHSKLVYIMRERLSKALKSFHSVSASWAAYTLDPEADTTVPGRLYGPASAAARRDAAGAGASEDPSATAASTAKAPRDKAVAEVLEQLMKQVGTLAAVLTHHHVCFAAGGHLPAHPPHVQ